MTILEGNKLIAEFMGYEVREGRAIEVVFKNETVAYRVTGLLYHSSWDWLMPVVDSIAALDEVYHWELSEETFSIDADKTFENVGGGIDKVWKTVVQFIQWYNSQKH
jgi:hypothetical protein